MRPLVLRIAGMRSYRAETVIDFSDLRLVTVTGATGSGKSTILEGITFALYGTATWAGGTTTPLISDGLNRMSVSLGFEADGQEWLVTRSAVRGSGTSGHELRCVSDPTIPPVDNARVVNARIQDLIGLDVDGFKSCVLLPQGRFDRLLKATPGDRVEALKGILGLRQLDTIHKRASETSKAANDRLLELVRHRGLFMPEPVRVAAEAQVILAEHEPRLAALEEVQVKVERLRDDAATLGEDASAADQSRAALEAVLDPAQLDRIASLIDLDTTLKAARDEAQQALANAQRRAKSVTRWRAARTAAGLDAASLAALLTRLDGLQRESAAITADEQRLAGERPDAAPAHEALRIATEAASRAQGEVQAAQALHAAHTASQHLHSGEACPVCASDLPDGWEPPAAPDDLDRLTTAAREAERERQQAASAAARADEAIEQHGREQARLDTRREALAEQFTAIPAWVAATDPVIAAARVRDEQDHLSKLTEKAERRSAGVAPAQTRFSDAQRAYDRQVASPADHERQQVKRLLTAVPDVDATATSASDTSTVPELHEWATTVHALAAKRTAELTERATNARAQVTAAQNEGRSLLNAQGFSKLSDLQNAHREVYAAVVNARQQRDKAQAQVESVTELDSLIADVEAVVAEHAEVAFQLGAKQFTGALIAQRQRALLAIASGILGDMTGGEFGFTEQFTMIARRSGVERGPETLSGGETFLASLALALALVELAGRTGGRLNALFIDEGFGSLDPDALSQAMTELARRAQAGRLIALISHVPVMAEQLDQTIEVIKTPSGSEVTVNASIPLLAAA